MTFELYICKLQLGCHPVAVHIYTQTIHRTIQNKQYIQQHNNFGRVRPCPVLANITLAFALQIKMYIGLHVKYPLPTLYLCVLYLSQNKQQLLPHIT